MSSGPPGILESGLFAILLIFSLCILFNGSAILFDLQILVLTLFPLLSGITPMTGSIAEAPALVGVHEPVTAEFMVGEWRYADLFEKWGITDKEKSRVTNVRSDAVMNLKSDGTMTMTNLFRPGEGAWEMTPNGLVIYDPKRPERGSQTLPVKKRDQNRIWLLLPFTGGSAGVGMKRAPE